MQLLPAQALRAGQGRVCQQPFLSPLQARVCVLPPGYHLLMLSRAPGGRGSFQLMVTAVLGWGAQPLQGHLSHGLCQPWAVAQSRGIHCRAQAEEVFLCCKCE